MALCHKVNTLFFFVLSLHFIQFSFRRFLVSQKKVAIMHQVLSQVKEDMVVMIVLSNFVLLFLVLLLRS